MNIGWAIRLQDFDQVTTSHTIMTINSPREEPPTFQSDDLLQASQS